MTIAAVPAAGLDARYPGPDSADAAAGGFDVLLADAQAAAPKPRAESRPAERTPARADEKARDEEPTAVDAPADAPVAETDEKSEPAVTAAIAPIALPVVVLPLPVPVEAAVPVVEPDAATDPVEATVSAATPTVVAEAAPELGELDGEPADEEQAVGELAPGAEPAPAAAGAEPAPAVEIVTTPDTAPIAEPVVPFQTPAAVPAPAPTTPTAAETAPTAEAPVAIEGVALTETTPAPADDEISTAAPPTAPAPVVATRVEAPVATEAPAEAAPTRSAPSEPPAEQLVSILRPLRQGEDGTYRLRLEMKPPELGRVELRVEMQDGVLSASLHADNDAAAQTLRDALADLRTQLESEGVRAGSLTVDDGRAGTQRDPRDTSPKPQPTRNEPARATTTTTAPRGTVTTDGLDVRV